MVAGSNPAVPTVCGETASVERRALDTLYLLLGIIGFFLIIALFFFGGFVLLDFLWGRRDLDDTIKRLQAFQKAGADVLYAPGLHDLDTIRTVCSALSKPVNVVMGMPGATFGVAELAEAVRALNDEDFVAMLPEEARAIVVAGRAQAKARRDKMMAGLKAATKEEVSA